MKLPKGRTILLAIASIFALLFVTNGVPYLSADGFYYYHVAKSMIKYHSFVTPERPEYYDYSAYAVAKYQDKYVEVVAPGTSLILLPGLSVASLFRGIEQNMTNNYLLAYNGHTLAEGVSMLITAMMAAIASFVLMYKALLTWGYSRKVTLIAVASSYLSSYAIWYVFLQPAYTHTYEILAISLVMWGIAKYYQYLEEKPLYWVGVGLGLAFLIRPIFAIFAIGVGLGFLVRRQFKQLAKVLSTSVPAIFVWLLYNYVSYGNALSTGYSQIRGETFGDTFNIIKLLFSPERGWFVYSPLMLLAMIGVLAWWFRSRIIGFTMILTTATLIGLYSFWPDWWGGYTFGQRFLLPLVPFAAFGIAELFRLISNNIRNSKIKSGLKRLLLVIIIILTGWSLLLTLLYRFTPVTTLYDQPEGELQPADRYTVIDILNYHKELVANATSVNDYANRLYASGNGGESIIVYLLGLSDRVLRVQNPTDGQIDIYKLIPDIYKPGDRDGEVTGYLSWGKDVYKISIPMNEENSKYIINCDEVCVGNSELMLTRVTEFPKTLSRDKFTCYLLQKDQKLCAANSNGNVVKGPKTDYSKQKSFYLP